MTLYAHVRLQVRSSLAEIDRDREAALSFEARYGGGPGFDLYVAQLAEDRQQHLMMLEGLQELRNQGHAVLLQEIRATRMAKALLRPLTLTRTGTGR